MQVYARKGPDYYKGVFRCDSAKDSERKNKKKSCRESFCVSRECIRNHQQNIERHVDTKDHSDEASDRNKETGGKAALNIQ